MKIIFIFFLVLISAVPRIIAQDKNEYKSVSRIALDSTASIVVKPLPFEEIKTDEKVNWHQMITNMPTDLSAFPQKAFESNHLPLFAILAAGTGALMLVDQRGWNENRRLYYNSSYFHNISDLGVRFGNEKYHFLMAGLFAAYGLAAKNPVALKTGSNIVEAVIASGIGVQVLKRIFGRESPAVSSRSAGRWQFFPNLEEYQKHQPKFYAYPSGHITTLTATVTVIANNFPQAKWIKPVGYTMIGICGIGLVSRGMHWYSDLPIGFFLGYTFGNLISPPAGDIGKDKSQEEFSGIKLSPMFFGKDLGLSLSYNF